MKTRVRRRFLELGRRDDARAAEGAWISTIHGFCARMLRAHALSAGIDPDFRVLDQVEAERLALEAFDGALEEFMAERRRPRAHRDGGRAHAGQAARHGAHRLLAPAQPRAAPARARADRRAAAGGRARAARGRRARRARRARRRPRRSATVAGAIEQLEAALDLLGKLDDGELPDAAELKALELKGRAKALSTPGLRGLPRGLRRVPLVRARAPGAARPHDAERAARALRRALRARQARALRARLRGPRAGRRATCSRATPGCARPTPSASRTCSSTSSRTRTRCRTSCSSCSRATTCSASGTRTSRSTASATPTWGCSASHWDDAVEAGRAESITVNFRARGEILDAIDLAFERTWGERFEPLREAPGVPRAGAARRSLRRAARGRQAEEALGRGALGLGDEPVRRRRSRPRRPGARRRRACSPSGSTSSRATGPYSFGDVVMLFRATTAMGFFERALEERGIPVHVVGGRGYFAQQQVSDLRHWLSALANPLDELAVYSRARLAARRPVARRGRADRPARPPLGAATPGGRSSEPADELLAVLPERDRRRLARVRRALRGRARAWPARWRSRR